MGHNDIFDSSEYEWSYYFSPLKKQIHKKKKKPQQILGIFLETQADEKKKMMGFYFSQLVLFKCQRVKRTRWQF